jgi:hypothetical protein
MKFMLKLPFCLLSCWQAAQLLCSFREYHRRASFGLAAFYGRKLAAFEDALLNAREALFSSQQELRQQGEEQQLLQVRGPAWRCEGVKWLHAACPFVGHCMTLGVSARVRIGSGF